jgi:hypothetical protein
VRSTAKEVVFFGKVELRVHTDKVAASSSWSTFLFSMWRWSCCCCFSGQKKSEILHMAIELAALMMNCCFPKNPWQSLCLSLAPHNPRAFQADPNANPS